MFLSSSAQADFPALDVRRFTPPMDPAGSLYLEPTLTPGAGAFHAASWLSYGYRPSVLRDEKGNLAAKLVGNQLSCDLMAAVGVTARGLVGVSLPLALYQEGDKSPIVEDFVGTARPSSPGIGDVAVVGKVNLLGYDPALGGFGLAGIGRVTFPTGQTASYVSERVVNGELRALAEYKLVAVALQATVGYRQRGQALLIGREVFGNEIPWGVAFVLKPQALGLDREGRFTWAAEAHGAFSMPAAAADEKVGRSPATTPLWLGLSARFAVGDASFVLGVESGVNEAFGAAPFRVALSGQYAPRRHDMDQDGVADDIDQCPELAEDRDGVEDGDGCPDYDLAPPPSTPAIPASSVPGSAAPASSVPGSAAPASSAPGPDSSPPSR